MSVPVCDFSVRITAICTLDPPTIGNNPLDPIQAGDTICFTNKSKNAVTVNFTSGSPFAASSFSVPADGNPHPQTVTASPAVQTSYAYDVDGCSVALDTLSGIIIVDPPGQGLHPGPKPSASAKAKGSGKTAAKTRSKGKAAKKSRGKGKKGSSKGKAKKSSPKRKKK